MKSKKIIVLSLIATLLLMFTLSVSAAESAVVTDLSFTMESEDSFVKTGTDFTVDLKVADNTGFKAAMVTITYDASKITFKGNDNKDTAFKDVEIEFDSLVDGNKGTIKVTIGNGVKAMTEDVPVLTAKGLVSTLTFTAVETAEKTSIDLALNTKNIVDENKVTGETAGLVVTANSKLELSVYAADHKHVEVVDKGYDAKCDTKGLSDGKHCSVCNEVLVPQTEIKELNHPVASQETLKAVDPTCTEKGKTEGKKCKLCGEIVVPQTDIDELKHPEASCEVLAAVAATCKDTGLTEGKKCKLCNEVLVAQNVVPALNHPSSSIKVIPAVDAACAAEGSTAGMTCTLCNEVLSAPETVAAKGHKYSEWKVTKEATKKEAGSENCTCANCGDVQVRAIAKLEGCGSTVIGMPIVLCVATVFGATMACKKKED